MIKVLKDNYCGYQLRYAGGRYYLLDMGQLGVPYKRPMELNDIGAQIWQMLAEGYTGDVIAERLASEYNAKVEDVRKDVLQFQKSLLTYGVKIGE